MYKRGSNTRMNSSGFYVVGVFTLTLLILFVVSSGSRIEPFVDAGRCGVDLPPCVGEHVRCINGYCRSDVPPVLPVFSDVPILSP